MPSLIRLIVFLGVIAGLAFGGMFALATLVKPQQSEMTIRIPVEKVNPKPENNGG